MFKTGNVWEFRTKRFLVWLEIQLEEGYRYDGDDPDGETQEKLDNGEYVAFESIVHVELDGEEIAWDALCGSVYAYDEVSDFWTAHRDSDPMNRNCSIMRGKHPAGPNVSIAHYFPGMVAEAIKEARQHVRNAKPRPYIRPNA